MDKKIKAMLLGTALLPGCTTWYIGLKDQRDAPKFAQHPEMVADCKENVPPTIYVIKNKVLLDTLVNVSVYDVDNRVVIYGWDIKKDYVYAIDECGAKTVYDNGKITTAYPKK